ncbi:MAG TPA: bifunctional lysylphosphatidylglycerol flippase/synthetase MprF [Steroidobacteraceae bacterium]|nr:bifunctional lysylphosphatidylglycerol flippase/synthetase MprF [Steroidobacteraceae bacterium]
MTAERAGKWSKWRPWAIGAVILVLSALVFDALHGLLREVSYANVVKQIATQPAANLLWAGLATTLSYLVLTGYDFSALRYAGAKVRSSTVLLTSFIAYALGNTVGLGVLTGGAVRMRLYTAAGVDAPRVAQAAAFNAGAFVIGMTAFGAAGLLWGAPDVAELVRLPSWLLRAIAVLLLLAVGALIAAAARTREIRLLNRWPVRLPPPDLAIRQLLISALDLTASAAALWFLLPSDIIGLPAFFAWYAMAVALGLLSHVPGGLGVFEAVILLACGGRAPPEQIIGALFLYRVVYYLLPLIAAAMLLAGYELRSGVAAPIGRAAVAISPLLLATLTFIAGAWLLVSGVTPLSGTATDLLELHVPLPLVEASHFIGSVAGFAMLVVARGLLHRLDAAWWSAFVLALVAAVLALPKGIALSEGAYLTVLAFLLLASRRQFDRRSALFSQALGWAWILSIAWVVAACLLILLFAYREVPYDRELWWVFEFDANAPRGLRAMMGVMLVGLGFALWQLLRPSPGVPALPGAAELDRAQTIVSAQPYADANLVLMGDKHLMFSASGNAFVMFGRQGRSWISLFDPIGPRSEWPELIWSFIEEATDHGGRAIFYQVRPESLSLYLDAGLRALKLGEYAYVPLQEFGLKGSKRADLRYAVHRAERDGLSFSVTPANEVAPLMPELRAVSAAWLGESRAREKTFSLGAFREEYLMRRPVALVRQRGTAIAFANVLCTQQLSEVSVDLMRQVPGSPSGTMDFLFTQLMLHFKEQGVQRFALGMAPMAGMEKHELAPRWHRFGRWLFDSGESFYNFRGLRSFKDKFHPVWEPRYLAAPQGVATLLSLADVTALIAGGVRGVFAK